MNLNSRWLSVLAAAAASGVIACGPPPTSKEIEQTPEGSSCPPTAMIENGEDNNNQVMVQDGRSGYWYTYADHEGTTIDPAPGETGATYSFSPGGVHGSGYAARMSGTVGKASIVYAGMGLSFTDPKGAYDAGKYGGISFWAKRGANSTNKVRVKVPDAATDPEGQICSACFNDFGMDLKLTEEWTKYTLLFGKMKQEKGWGSPHPGSIANDKLFGLQFQVNDKGQPFDILVDDVTFTGCGGSAGAAAAPADAPPVSPAPAEAAAKATPAEPAPAPAAPAEPAPAAPAAKGKKK